MDDTDLIRTFQEKLCKEIEIESLGINGYAVYTPFMFDDGDHFVVLLKKGAGGWYFTDNGHTLMHLSYADLDLSSGTRGKFVEETLTLHGVDNKSGELRFDVPGDAFGDALYSYVQAITRVATVTQWHQERVASTFADDLLDLLRSIIPDGRATYDWHHPANDPDGNYSADCRINERAKPCVVFGVGSDAKCNHATICCLMYEKWGMPFQGVVLFEDQTQISRKPLAQLSNVVDKQFPSLGDRSRIEAYFRALLESR
jgi:hypothetical protein